MSSSATAMDTGYLDAKNAAALDAELMSTPGFSLEQVCADVTGSDLHIVFSQL